MDKNLISKKNPYKKKRKWKRLTNKLRATSKKQFFRNVFTVASGTAAAQAIYMLFSPFITRLYGPEAFGILGTFVAITAIVTPIAALTFPIAIVLPKEDSEAKGLIKLSLFVGIFIAIFTGIILYFFIDPIVDIFKIEALSPFLFFIPLVMLFATGLQIMQQWLIRKKQFKLKAKIAVAQAFLVNGTQAGSGVFYPFASTLIYITVFGQAIYTLMLTYGSKITSSSKNLSFNFKVNGDKPSLLILFKKYFDFPVYRAPEAFLNAVSQSLPILFLTSLFGPAAAGFYVIGKKVLGLPSQLIGNAIGDVFYPRMSEAAQKNESLEKLLFKTTISLALVGIVPFGIIIIFGPWLFSFVFGAEWDIAGQYARWLALGFFFGFLNIPSVKTLPVISAQRLLLIFSVSAIVFRLIALMMGGLIFKSDIIAVVLYSIVGVILNIILILKTLEKSRKFDATNDKKKQV